MRSIGNILITLLAIPSLVATASANENVEIADHSTFESSQHEDFESPDFPGGDESPGHPAKPRRKKPGDRNCSDSPPARYQQNNWSRSGCANRVACWARPSLTKRYYGGYVGGGAALCGHRRAPEEGTWGTDYKLLDGVKVFLNWTCGRHQGHEGAYATDHESLREE